MVIAISANAQKTTENIFEKVSKKVKSQKLYEIQVIKNKPLSKKTNCLTYKCENNLKTSFCNNNSDENYVEFQELGHIENTKITIVKKLNYNQEFYILLNKNNCNVLTLDGLPLRIEKTNLFIVNNNPSTDQRKKIQILQQKDGQLSLLGEVIFPEKIKLKSFISFDSNEVYIVDEKNQIWKTVIKK